MSVMVIIEARTKQEGRIAGIESLGFEPLTTESKTIEYTHDENGHFYTLYHGDVIHVKIGDSEPTLIDAVQF